MYAVFQNSFCAFVVFSRSRTTNNNYHVLAAGGIILCWYVRVVTRPDRSCSGRFVIKAEPQRPNGNKSKGRTTVFDNSSRNQLKTHRVLIETIRLFCRNVSLKFTNIIVFEHLRVYLLAFFFFVHFFSINNYSSFNLCVYYQWISHRTEARLEGLRPESS